MNKIQPQLVVSGAAMDIVIKQKPLYRKTSFFVALLALVAAGIVVWYYIPKGLQVERQSIRVASVGTGKFLDTVSVRTTAAPLASTILDSIESGRVEEIYTPDGAVVKKNDLLFRLSNPQRSLELLARRAEYAQQISNLSTLRTALETNQSEHQRRLTDIHYNVDQAEKQFARNRDLYEKKYISNVVWQESVDSLAKQRRSLQDEVVTNSSEITVRNKGIVQMEKAIASLESGLKLVGATVDALTVRAPAEGRLTNFHLQIGETVKTGDHIGRIDDPSQFKLTAQIDEFYLNRITVGQKGNAEISNQAYPVEVVRIFPQIKDGHFSAELGFAQERVSALSLGQSVDASILLGEAKQALLLPAGNYLNDSGGNWVFVLTHGATEAVRRAVKLGRRNHSQVEVVYGLVQGEQVIVSDYAEFGAAERLQITQ